MQSNSLDLAVLLIFFNRPDCVRQTFDSIKKARPAKLYLYQDGPRNQSDIIGIDECRKIVAAIDWPCEVHTFFQNKNMGVDPSEYIAIKWAFFREKKCLVLEDDDVPTVSFFGFCKFALDRFENDPHVGQISGLTFGGESKYSSKYSFVFSRFGCIWGWASWKRVIDQWDPSYSWLDKKEELNKLSRINRKTADDVIALAKKKRTQGVAYYEIINGVNLLLHSYYVVVPTKNCIHNIGLTNGAHSSNDDLSLLPKRIYKIYTMPSYEIKEPYIEPPLYFIDKKIEKSAMNHKPPFEKIEILFRYILHGRFDLIVKKLRKK